MAVEWMNCLNYKTKKNNEFAFLCNLHDTGDPNRIFKKVTLCAKEHDVSAIKWPFSRRPIQVDKMNWPSWERPLDGQNVSFLGK